MAKRIERQAKRDGVSLNKTIKSLLRSSLGLTKPPPIDHREDFLDLFGSWSAEESAAFDARSSATRQIKPSDWQR